MRIMTIVVISLLSILLNSNTANAQSSWVVKETIDVPFDAPVNIIVFDDNTTRHYLVLEDGFEVYIHPESYTKFKEKKRGLVLVEWYNIKTGRYKYTVRLAEPEDAQTKIDINKLWKNQKDHH